MTFPPANAIYRRETYDNYPAARAIMQVVYEGLQLPIDLALRVEVALVREDPALAGSGGMIRSLFVSMQELNKGARRPKDVPPAKFKKVGIIGAGFMGAEHRLCHGARRHRGRADRPRPGVRRQGQGAFPQADDRAGQPRPRHVGRARRAAGAHHAERRLRRAHGLRPRDRGGVRGPQGQGRDHQEGAGGDRRQRDLRLQHLDAADHVAGGRVRSDPAQLHRHPFLLAGRAHDAGRDHPRQEDRRRALATALDYVRAIRKTPIVVNDSRGFYANRCVLNYIQRRPPDADRGRAGGDDRERRRAWPACRSARCRSTTRSRSISAGRS